MGLGTLDELIRALDALPVAAALTDLTTRRFVAVNARAERLFGFSAADLVGHDALERVHPEDRPGVELSTQALASGVIDGYQVQRRILTPEGGDVLVSVWGRRFEVDGDVYALWTVVPVTERGETIDSLVLGPASVVLAVTDHDWQIEFVNADAGLLGGQGSDLRGLPLLGLVHPADASQFLQAAGRAAADRMSVTVLTRLRAGPGRWETRHCLITAMCEHQPPRLGLVISRGPAPPEAGPAPPSLDDHVRHSALEARGVDVVRKLPALARLVESGELSARQCEILARLADGQRPADIARSMYLSPSTVRNHLAAIYRKFGVHSQAELLALLLRATTQGDH
jgi:PAS domain S-box-containing protein